MLKTKQLLMKATQRSVMLAMMLLTVISAQADDLQWTFAFTPSDIVLSPVGEYTVVTLADGSDPRDAVGAPAIPAKYANILLPSGATDVTVTASGDLVPFASDVTPWPVQRVAPKSKPQPPFTAPNPAAYASAIPWPGVAATFEGLHEMQGSTFVSVRVNPIVYVAAEKALYYRPSVTVTVSYSVPAGARGVKANARVAEMVNALVVNPKAAASDGRRAIARAASTVDYLIITSASLANAFQALADYRATAIGGSYSTLVVTKESIASSYSGDDIQMKIRNCISDYVTNHGTTYVVLGGDDSVVPDRDTYACVDEGESTTTESCMPTDLYYSDLTGTWKASGNNNFGVVKAKVDMSPDVIVGRIPVRTDSQLSGYLAKVQAYEADLTYKRNAIILGGPAAWCRYSGNKRPSDDVTGDGHRGFRDSHDYVSDSEMWLRRLYRDGIRPYWDNVETASDRTVNLACDAITSWDGTNKCGYKQLTASNLKTWLNNGYTHLMFSGHGFPQGWGMEGASSSVYSTTQAAAQTNLTAFVYTDACMTAAFDEDGYQSSGITIDVGTSEQYRYDSEPCLGEAFVRNANGGALVYMGCSRYGWGEADYQSNDPDDQDSEGYYTKCTASNTSNGGPSTVYAYKFYKRLYEEAAIAENRTVGKAFAMSKADMISKCSKDGCERWIQFGLNYLGDPAIALYPRSGGAGSIAEPTGLAVSDVAASSFTASWNAVDEAESYEIDVVKGTSFEASAGGVVLESDFSSTTGWTLSGTGTYTGAGYYGASSPAIKFSATGNYMITPVFSGGTQLQFWALGNGGSGSTFDISGLVNGTWTAIETVTIENGGKTYTVSLPAGTTQLRFDFTKSVNCALDDVVVYGTGNTVERVSGYPKNVGNVTSYTVTELTQETEYSVRVRAVNSDGDGNWSTAVVATTLAEGSDEPTEPIDPTTPVDYYKNADGKKGAALKTAMCGIIYDHTQKSYDYLWTAFQTTDVRSDGKIWDMYSDITNYEPGGSAQGATYTKEGDCYNREHSFPKSWFGEGAPMYTDLHHLYPTDGYVNGRRSNYPFGETDGERYMSTNGFSKLGTCTYPGYTGIVFEPADEYKGDFARTYFYMVTCYEEKLSNWYSSYSESQPTLDGNKYPGLSAWQLEMLMKWAKEDPVSEKETNRNNAVYAIQKNRNPFIDYPGLEEYVWGTMTTTAFSYDNYVRPTDNPVEDPVTVPTLAVNAATVTNTSAQVSWNACDEVTEYTLQLASDDQFSTGGNGGQVTLVENEATSNTAPTDWTYNIDSRSGSYLILASGHYVVTSAFDASACTDLELSFYMRTYGGTDYPDVTVQYSTDDGATWSESLGTLSAENSTMAKKTLDISEVAGNASVRLRIASVSESNKGVGIKTIVIRGTASAAGSLLATETVNGTSYTFSDLTPGTTYYTRVKGNADWSNVVSFTTTSIEYSAPVWSDIPAQTVAIGETLELDLSVYVSGLPEPTIGLAESNLNASLTGSIFSFTPTASGDYSFTFTATNSEGSANAVLSVTVPAPPVTVPTLAISDIAEDGAVVSWTACDDVTEYTLQIATDDQFSVGGFSEGDDNYLLDESFEDGSIPTGWTSSSAVAIVSGKDGDGTYSVAFKGAGAYLITPLLDHPGNVSFIYRRSSNTTAWGLKVSYANSVDGPWTEIGSVSSATTSWQTFSEALDNVGSVYIKFTDTRSSGSAERYIDLIQIAGPPSGGSLIVNETVTGTSYTVTGLDAETTYYARVKGNADWSDVVEFSTCAEAVNTLDLANDADNSDAISAAVASGGKYDVTLTGRTLWKDGDWNTLCLPFSTTKNGPLADATIKELDTAGKYTAEGMLDDLNGTLQTGFDASSGTLYLFFKEVETIEAGKPYLVKWTDPVGQEEMVSNPVFSSVTVTSASPVTVASTSSSLNTVELIGTYSPVGIANGDKSRLFLGAKNKLYYPDVDQYSVYAFRAYFHVDLGDAANVRAFVLNIGEEEPTGVSSTKFTHEESGWYSLDGRKLVGRPTVKGLYINNGRKVVIK